MVTDARIRNLSCKAMAAMPRTYMVVHAVFAEDFQAMS